MAEKRKTYQIADDKEFWARHERANKSKERKNDIRDDVMHMLNILVEKYSNDEFDARRDIAWFLEQFGKDLRSEVDREKTREREQKLRSE